jgi:SH3 domain protein
VIIRALCKYGLLLALACGSGVAGAARTMYVTDILRLGVFEAADTSGRAFVNLESGDEVTVLEENPYYARVTLSDGRPGWVKKTFLTEKQPARFRITQVEAERDRALEEVGALKKRIAGQQSEVGKLKKQVDSQVEGVKAEQGELEELRRNANVMRSQLEVYRDSVPLSWLLLAVLICLVVGFFTGRWWLNRLNRKRHGGFIVR